MSADTEQTSSEMYLATLVRGECYHLREIRFDEGIPTVIMDHHREHLREYAVDVVGTEDGEVMVKDKFVFAPYDGPLEVGATTIVSPAKQGATDPGIAARLRSFGEKEAARLAKVPTAAPKFDAEARRAEVERPAAQADGEEGEVLAAPRPRTRPAASARTITA